MKSIVVCIGNSDNALSQQEWQRFVNDADLPIREHAKQVHFFGGPPNWWPWQNVAWWLDIEDVNVEALKTELTKIRKVYNQDSIAWLEGETQFV